MKYIKESLFITTLLLSTAYSQCDANGDGDLNIQDIVILANCVLDDNCDDIPNGCSGDLNGDDVYNILDIVILNCVLAGDCDEI